VVRKIDVETSGVSLLAGTVGADSYREDFGQQVAPAPSATPSPLQFLGAESTDSSRPALIAWWAWPSCPTRTWCT
jgi:hypothetical protein